MNEYEESQFNTFQQEMERIVGECIDSGPYNFYNPSVEGEELPFPYRREVGLYKIRNAAEAALRGAQSLGQLDRQSVTLVSARIGEIEDNTVSDEEFERQLGIYENCREFARHLDMYLGRALDQDYFDSHTQHILPEPVRRMNQERAVEGLRDVSRLPLSAENIEERTQMLRSTSDTYLFDVHDLYRRWAISRGLSFESMFPRTRR